MDTSTADIQSTHPLLYADDVLLANEERQTLKDQVQQWKDRLNEKLNLTKTEYMEYGLQTGRALHLSPDERHPRGRPMKRWMDRIKQDMKQINAAPEDALDRKKWRAMCQTADPAPVWDKR